MSGQILPIASTDDAAKPGTIAFLKATRSKKSYEPSLTTCLHTKITFLPYTIGFCSKNSQAAMWQHNALELQCSDERGTPNEQLFVCFIN